MANREELSIIRAARAGQVAAQLALGRLYLFGGASLPSSLPTALHWLERAARQGSAEACELIGAHIPLALAQRSERPLARWVAHAYDAGVAGAGLLLAQLVLGESPEAGADAACRAKARTALAQAARAGVADAQWLLSRQPGEPARPGGAERDAGAPEPQQRWLRSAADSGVAQAQFALLDAAWQARQWPAYLERALPLARALLQGDPAGKATRVLAPADVTLLSRCARALAAAAHAGADRGPTDRGPTELQRFWEMAAAANDRHAQLALGLWCARMRADGSRTAVGARSANFKKAIRWLTLAGEQGLAEAWYALARIYSKTEFSQRNVGDAQMYLERAAEMGYRDAQFECGHHAWRARREHQSNDVRAVYWLQKAAAHGCARSTAALSKIAAAPANVGNAWPPVRAALAASHPLLAARLELAAMFQLSRAEALLLDIRQADQGHCLVVDIRASYGRSKRRLVLVETAQQRHALDRIVRLFDHVDGGPGGPEGNYRQRLYRLKTLTPNGAAAFGDSDDLAA